MASKSVQSSVQKQLKKLINASDFHGLNLLFDLIKDRNAIQIDQADKLNSKVSSTLNSATVIVSATLTIQEVLPSLQSAYSKHDNKHAFTSISTCPACYSIPNNHDFRTSSIKGQT